MVGETGVSACALALVIIAQAPSTIPIRTA
jgi:hypothetical protein